MNPELYSDEFRNFKYLKSSYEAVQFFKNSAEYINKIRYVDKIVSWPTRIEFFEQILDLQQDTIYFVVPGQLNRNDLEYEYARILEIQYPFLYSGSALSLESGKPASIEDILDMEKFVSSREYFLCSANFMRTKITGLIRPVHLLPIKPSNRISFSAMFYDKDWAKRYQYSLTMFLRKTFSDVSTINMLP